MLATNGSGAQASTAAEVAQALRTRSQGLIDRAHPYRSNAGTGVVAPTTGPVALTDFLDQKRVGAPEGEVPRGPATIPVLRIGKHRDGRNPGVLIQAQDHTPPAAGRRGVLLAVGGADPVAGEGAPADRGDAAERRRFLGRLGSPQSGARTRRSRRPRSCLAAAGTRARWTSGSRPANRPPSTTRPTAAAPPWFSPRYQATEFREPGQVFRVTETTTFHWFSVDTAGNVEKGYDPSKNAQQLPQGDGHHHPVAGLR
nr:hypothetical protein [Micromonospora craniellae]